MPAGAVGRLGFSPDVLFKWVAKNHANNMHIVQGQTRFMNYYQLTQILNSEENILFILVSVIVRQGHYGHMISITGDFILLDSELNSPCALRGRSQYNSIFARYQEVVAVSSVLRGTTNLQKKPTALECYDLTDHV
jgi:hypothetical protein